MAVMVPKARVEAMEFRVPKDLLAQKPAGPTLREKGGQVVRVVKEVWEESGDQEEILDKLL